MLGRFSTEAVTAKREWGRFYFDGFVAAKPTISQ